MSVASAEVAAAVAQAHRREWAFVLAAVARSAGGLDVAEEAVQDAYARALTAWERGIPANPGAWLTTVAKRRALDLQRHADVARRALPKLALPSEDLTEGADGERDDVYPDERLRLVFTCCHPALPVEARTALALRLLCGLSTAEIARAFLVSEPTMAARITRAKHKIARAHIPYAVPSRRELPERVEGVLSVVHLVYTTGHTAPAGAALIRRELTGRAVDLAEMLHVLLPHEPEVAGLLALIYLTEARRAARLDSAGAVVMLQDQDRGRWDRALISSGIALLDEALNARAPGRFALMAAIGAVHDRSPGWRDTDWSEIARIYDLLIEVWPSPVVELNRAIAHGFAFGPETGLEALDALSGDPRLARYAYLPAARADFLARLSRRAEALLAYDEAIILTENESERAFLRRRRAAVETRDCPDGVTPV